MLPLMLLAQFFEAPAVDFWDARARKAAPDAAGDWSEPGHTPPPAVARLLEKPTRENALAYLRWQEERLARLQAALRAIEEARPKEKEVLYFAQEKCAYGAEQERVLAQSNLGGRAVRRLTPADAPELWAKHGVTATPTLVIDGRALRGLQTRERIEKEVRK